MIDVLIVFNRLVMRRLEIAQQLSLLRKGKEALQHVAGLPGIQRHLPFIIKDKGAFGRFDAGRQRAGFATRNDSEHVAFAEVDDLVIVEDHVVGTAVVALQNHVGPKPSLVENVPGRELLKWHREEQVFDDSRPLWRGAAIRRMGCHSCAVAFVVFRGCLHILEKGAVYGLHHSSAGNPAKFAAAAEKSLRGWKIPRNSRQDKKES